MPADSLPPRLVVLISGGGTTLVNLHRAIKTGELSASIELVIASRDCTGIARAAERDLAVDALRRSDFNASAAYSVALFERCRAVRADFVVLAGFLSQLVIPPDFEHRVLNIHPSLIPAFCGKGMYGLHVHEAVLARGCQITGCTVHFCDNEYDHGPIIRQAAVPVEPNDTPETLSARVFAEECRIYPQVIAEAAAGLFEVKGRRVSRRPT